MGAPRYEQKTNKRTGESRWFVSDDDGHSWAESEPPAAPAPEPATAPVPAQAAPLLEQAAPAPQTEQPWYEVLARGARDTAGMGFSDEAAGLGAKLAGPDVERRAGRGMDAPIDPNATAYSAERDYQRGEDATALRDSPTLYRAGEVAGLAGTAAAPFAKLGKLAPAALGAANAVGSTNDTAMDDLAKDAAVGGVMGELGGRALGAVGKRVAPALRSKFSQWAADAARESNKRYLRASGATKGALDRMGDKGITRYAAAGRRLGIGKGIIPKTIESFGDDAQRVADQSNAERQALEEVIKEKGGAPVDPDKLSRSIKSLKGEHAKGGPTGQPLRDEIDRIADETSAMREPSIKTPVDVDAYEPADTIRTNIDPPSPLTPSAVKRIRAGEMNDDLAARFQGGKAPTPLRIDVEQAAAPQTLEIPRGIPWSRANKERVDLGNSINFTPNTPRAAIRPRVYGKLNEALGDAANEAAPGVGDKWRQAGENEHVGILLNELARGRENSEAANRVLSLSDQGLGAAVGVASGDPTAGVATAMGNKMLRAREHALAERVLRGKSAVQGRIASSMQRVPLAARLGGARATGQQGTAAARRLPMMFGSPAHADNGGDAMDELAGASPADRSRNARGQMLPDAAMQLLKTEPQALGKWAPELLEARKQGEGQFAARIQSLQSDPAFSRDVLPRLQAMTVAKRD